MSSRDSLVDSRRARRRAASNALIRAAIVTAVGILPSGLTPARGAELRLRPECQCRGPVVTLGDVAEVYAADPRQAEALAAIELCPAPACGVKRFLQPRQIQDVLMIRGINLVEHRLSGASQVTILGAGEESESVPREPLSASVRKKAERRISDAVLQYLQQQVAATEPWTVEVTLEDTQARRLAECEGEVAVRGGQPPWIGIQRFEVTASSANAPVRFDLDARVDVLPGEVVAVRSLPRGAVIRAGDVALRRAETRGRASEGFHSLDEVLGKETTRTISVGKALDRKSVREPLLVRRGEVITVYARSAGVQVRTTARAREDGSLGGLIEVESLLDRASYFARVSGIQEAEVYARAPRAGQAAYLQHQQGTGRR